MDPHLRYCTSGDGTRIAFYTWGDGPSRIIATPWLTNLERDLERPEGRRFFETLGDGRQLVWYDRRGVGNSERDVDDLTFEAQVADFSAVVEALRLECFDLLAVQDGAAVSVAYAERHPENLSEMVFLEPIIYGADVATEAAFRSHIDLARKNWSLLRRSLASLAFPSGPIEDQKWMSNYTHEIVSPEVAANYVGFVAEIDVRTAAAQLDIPTLILHRRGHRVVPIATSRRAAATIPDAQLVALEGEVGIFYLGDETAALHIKAFLDERRTVSGAAEMPVKTETYTILFTDMASSTALTQQLGDAGAQTVRRAHNEVVRSALRAHDGSEIKHTGDGIMASFSTASSALDAATAIQRGVAAHREEHPDSPLSVYVGLNAGEPITEDDDLFGTSINLAARICDHAQPGQILAADVVRQLAAGKDFLFGDLGDTELRGFEDPVRLWELRWQDA